jgi:tRNA-specific 2-thiouridylase
MPPALPARCGAKTRYRMPDATCTLAAADEGCRATFDVAQWAPTPGQYLVLYDGDVCLGGGVIAASSALAAGGAQPPGHPLTEAMPG